ncbi:HlyC/CorC family transporter [Fulvivirga sp. RKSG066]|uniref:CNNM domain-containing protein n=1 Tax=Fulvivirga aurantia TaxID=2529383 RepID=UPI0012BD3E19|nr:hemolysin family protein [Fulvivirga aurantia]MTI19779.1 HlyC/CorC family transporter [Fulvivirga aurantia]
MVLLIVYLSIALLVSFLCSILEAVLLSITPSYVESLKQDESSSLGQNLEKLKDNIDRPLAAILSFNTIAHTVGAAGVGAQAAVVFGNKYLGLVSAVLTLLILVFSEIIPKTIGASYWRSLIGFSVKTLNVLIVLMYPLVIMSKGITKLLSKDENSASVSRAELSAMADIGEKEGVFAKTESKMIKNLVTLRNIMVEDVMTPRTVIVMMQEDKQLQELFENETFKKFSRIPVFKKNRDDISGYVHKVDVLSRLAEDQHELTLRDIKREVLMVAHTMKLPIILDRFVESKEHFALVTDRYGGVAGLVTMEDIMETLLGREIMDEFDGIEDMQEYARNQWRQRAQKLGLLIEENEEEQTDETSEDVAKFGITGGTAPNKEN